MYYICEKYTIIYVKFLEKRLPLEKMSRVPKNKDLYYEMLLEKNRVSNEQCKSYHVRERI